MAGAMVLIYCTNFLGAHISALHRRLGDRPFAMRSTVFNRSANLPAPTCNRLFLFRHNPVHKDDCLKCTAQRFAVKVVHRRAVRVVNDIAFCDIGLVGGKP